MKGEEIMSDKIMKRSEVIESQTWDFSHIYKEKKDWENDFSSLKDMIEKFCKNYEGKLESVEDFKNAIVDLNEIYTKDSKVYHYSSLPFSVDATNTENKKMTKLYDELNAWKNEKLSFFSSSLMSINDECWDELNKSMPEYNTYLRLMRKHSKSKLHPEVEKAFAALTPIFAAPYNIYHAAKLCDMEFEDFEVDGKTYPNSFNLYEGKYMYDKDVKVRRKAFDEFSKVLSRYKNVVGENYYTQVKTEKIMATLRGFDSVIDFLLYEQEVDRDMFDRQLDVIMDELSPVMRRYARLLKKVRGLDEIHFSDLKIDIDPDYSPKATIGDAKELVEKSVSIMGEEYLNTVMRYVGERWIDYPQNIGKETGGYATMVSGVHPYVLMSWSDNLSSVYTLIHELGHCAQFLYTDKNNKLLNSEMSMYLVEAPSTFNELLLTNYLMKQANENDDKRMERFAISKLLSDTYFHNFVTHLLEAVYQREVYNIVDKGESFDGDKLSEIMRSVLEKFWGDDVIIDKGAELTWMRQPHYYMGLYPYTYSAGLTVATQAFLKIRNGEEKYKNKWIEFLSNGVRYTPQEGANMAGVDIGTDSALKNSIKYLSEMMDRLEELSK